MRPQSCKAKGRRLQQQVRDDLLRSFPSLDWDDVKSTSMGAGGEDIQLSPAAQQAIPYSFEAKNTERLNVWSAIEQAASNSRGRTPCVVFKKNRSPTYAALPWEHLLALISRKQGEEERAAGGAAAALSALSSARESVALAERLLLTGGGGGGAPPCASGAEGAGEGGSDGEEEETPTSERSDATRGGGASS